MIEEIRPDVYDIGIFDKYIYVKVKLDDGTNSDGKKILLWNSVPPTRKDF